MKRSILFYLLALRNSFASRIAYRADFFFSSFMIFITEFIIPFITVLIYQRGASFPGWNLYEVLMVQGVFMLSRGIANVLFFGVVWNTLDRVREGTYDILLLKPGSSLFISIATNFEPDSIGTVLGGLLICAFSLFHLPTPEAINIVIFLFTFVLSLVVLFSFALLMAGSVFKWVGNSRIYEIFDSIVAFGNYPRTIFSRAFQNIIAYILPIATVGFLPASVLLGKNTDNLMIISVIVFLFLMLSALYWKMMLKKYTSAGG